MGPENQYGGAASSGRGRVYYLAAAVLALIGLGIFNDIRESRMATSGWTQAEATITRCTVKAEAGRVPQEYSAFVEYRFDVNGAVYTGGPAEVHRDKVYTSADEARAALRDGYPEGGKADVYYNPQNPVESGLGATDAPSIFWAVLFFCLAAAALSMARRPGERP